MRLRHDDDDEEVYIQTMLGPGPHVSPACHRSWLAGYVSQLHILQALEHVMNLLTVLAVLQGQRELDQQQCLGSSMSFPCLYNC